MALLPLALYVLTSNVLLLGDVREGNVGDASAHEELQQWTRRTFPRGG
jgi:hypothetical protein